jgi:predicted Zn-dependent protease
MKVESRLARSTTILLLLILTSASVAEAQRTELKPGWNIFSVEEDVEMGRQVSREAEQQLAIIDDRELEGYLNRLGRRLSGEAPGADYPYQFKLVNDKTINAFALPGGFIYVNRGIIEAADREAEFAGVIGHEIGHVASRHSTNQASKAYLAEAPLAILDGVFGGGGVASVLTQLGIGFTANSVLMKFSRDAERQADLLGAQILFDAGYDPTE